MKKSAKLSVAMSSIAVLLVGVLGVVYAATSSSGSGGASGVAGASTANARIIAAQATSSDPSKGTCTATNTGSTFAWVFTGVKTGFQCTLEVSITNDGPGPMSIQAINNDFGSNEATYLLQDATGCTPSTPGLSPMASGATGVCTLVYTATQNIPNPLPLGQNTDWVHTIDWQSP